MSNTVLDIFSIYVYGTHASFNTMSKEFVIRVSILISDVLIIYKYSLVLLINDA